MFIFLNSSAGIVMSMVTSSPSLPNPELTLELASESSAVNPERERRSRIQALVHQLGETDQLSLNNPSPQLAIQRAQVRQSLASYSEQKQEMLYLLGEAAVILETVLMEAEEKELHWQLSSQLASVYQQFYHTTHEKRYLTVIGHILRPHSSSGDARILLGLARMDAANGHKALTRHWLSLWAKLPVRDLAEMIQSPEFTPLMKEHWMQELLQSQFS